MENFLIGLKNFLNLIINNWTLIITIIGMIILIYKKVTDYLKLSNDDKINIALSQIKDIALKLVTDAELEWEDYNKSGSLKRSQVLDKIYEQFPILKSVIDKEDLIVKIDYIIDAALIEMREIIETTEVKE